MKVDLVTTQCPFCLHVVAEGFEGECPNCETDTRAVIRSVRTGSPVNLSPKERAAFQRLLETFHGASQ